MAAVYLVFLKSVTVYWKYFICDSSNFFIKSRLRYMFEKQIDGYKRVEDITSFHERTSPHFIMV